MAIIVKIIAIKVVILIMLKLLLLSICFEEKVTRNLEIQQVGQRVQNRFLRFCGMVDKA